MILARVKTLYKHRGTQKPRVLYEVWKADDGEFLVDIWRWDTDNVNVYKLDDTMSLNYFEEGNEDILEKVNMRYRVVDNNYLVVYQPRKEKELLQLKKLMHKYKREAFQLIEGIR